MANHPGRERTVKQPIPVERLVQALGEGRDYIEGLAGYVSSRYDLVTGVLNITFEREADDEADEGSDFASADYYFQHVGHEETA